jgi:hypothetical protein
MGEGELRMMRKRGGEEKLRTKMRITRRKT